VFLPALAQADAVFAGGGAAGIDCTPDDVAVD